MWNTERSSKAITYHNIPSGEHTAGSSERITNAAETNLLPSSDSICGFAAFTPGLPVNLGFSPGSCLTRMHTHNSSVAKTKDFPGTSPPVSFPSPNSGKVSFSAAPSSTRRQKEQC